MVWTHILLALARVASAGLAGFVAFFALRAYFASRKRSLLRVGIAASLLSGGYLLEGALVETGVWSLQAANAFEAVITLAALVTLVSSLYVREPHRRSSGRLHAPPEPVAEP